jgi:pantoate--beta-alanine ligase
MKIFKDPAKMQKWCLKRKREGATIALVPTMGYLHEGHLSLVETAKKRGAQEVIVSIFVNPVQFGPNEDYEKYPRDEKADLEKCRKAGVTAVFFPTPQNMYLEDHSVYVEEELLSRGLCGARRPGHFRGVCTVVAKLFNITAPDFAVFGRKDYQQAQIIRRMVRDLNFAVKIVLAPIVREKSGLARSSRNVYLSEKEKAMALSISAGLKAFKSSKGAMTIAAFKRSLEKAGLKIDYVECVDAQTLEGRSKPSKGCCVLVAAFAGKTRLIDNITL